MEFNNILYCIPIFLIFDSAILYGLSKLGTKLFKSEQKSIEIFQENTHSLCHYTLSSLPLIYLWITNFDCVNSLGLIVTTNKCVYNQINLDLYNLIILFDVSYYIVSIVYSLFYKRVKRKDQLMLYMHHIITFVLIYTSYINDFGKYAGFYILFTHNLCDIPLNIYLLVSNLKKLIWIPDIIGLTSAILSICLFGYLRIFLFGSLNLYLFKYNDELNFISNVLVFILYLFNLKWFGMMIYGCYIELIQKKDYGFIDEKNI